MQSQQTLQNGRYRITQEMGRGGMGIIYQGRDKNLQGRLVAIKENLDDARDSQKQFRREAVILAKLNHSNLPRVTDYFIESSDRQYLIMDYVEGIDLKDIVRKLGPLPEKDVLLWTEQVMEALEYLHGWIDPDTKEPTPVIHRDIKPSNIRRMPGNQIMLVDFGIAKVGTTGTWAGARSITPGYSPIEQYGDETDARSDIYALGATLYYLLTSVAPPEAHKEIPPIRKINPGITAHTARVIHRAMQKNVNERYQSVKEMRDALFEPTWWEQINLPSSGSVLPRIGDALAGRTTEPRSTRSRGTADRSTGSGRTGGLNTGSRRTASQRSKTASQKREPHQSSKTAPQPGASTPQRNPILLFLLFTMIVIGAILIFMYGVIAPSDPDGEIGGATNTVAIAFATETAIDTATVTPLPTEMPTDTLTATSTPTASPSSTSTPIFTLTPISTVTAFGVITRSTRATSTPIHTLTATTQPTDTPTGTSTPIHTPTATTQPTHTPTATAINTATATNTLTPIATATAIFTWPPSSTTIPTSTSTLTPRSTFTPVPTWTSTPTQHIDCDIDCNIYAYCDIYTETNANRIPANTYPYSYCNRHSYPSQYRRIC